MLNPAISWQYWALLAAVFAAFTAILAKVGVSDVEPDFATFFRTCVILVALAILLISTGKFISLKTISGKSLLFLTLSGMATGASWLCYFRALKIGNASQVAPIDKISIVLVAIFAGFFLGEKLSALNWVGIVFIVFGAFLVAVK
jgi:transporter family protein